MNLKDYIKKQGAAKFAAKFGVTPRAALAWQYGTRLPRAKVAQKIVDETPVTFEGIYGQPSDSHLS
jgi:hypothetical protein